MKSITAAGLAFATGLAVASVAVAQEMGRAPGLPPPEPPLAMHGMGAPLLGDQGPSAQGLREAKAKMHQDMAIGYTGNADIDFVRSMIPHHQGAVDMARIELQYGTDPEIRRRAEEIIAAQEAEIARLQAWLARRGGR